MKTHCQFLSENEQLKIHEKSIKILEEVGVKFLSDKALKVLEKNGARVDYAEKLAKIPREMVDQALKTAPKSFVLGARNPEFDVAYPSAHTGYVLDCGGVFTFDYKKGERRYSTLQDCEDAFRIFEEMSLGSYTSGRIPYRTLKKPIPIQVRFFWICLHSCLPRNTFRMSLPIPEKSLI